MSKIDRINDKAADRDNRRDLLIFLRELSDVDLQRRKWLNGEDYPNSSGIDEVLHFLFDDTNLASDPTSEVGGILENQQEAELLILLCRLLDDMVERLGDVSSEHYMRDGQWTEVRRIARAFLDLRPQDSSR